jgi:hypothetical protein
VGAVAEQNHPVYKDPPTTSAVVNLSRRIGKYRYKQDYFAGIAKIADRIYGKLDRIMINSAWKYFRKRVCKQLKEG